jgi:hypothetical protein
MSQISTPCQLLCASNTAYSILPSMQSGWFNPCGDNNIYYNSIGFVGDPYVVSIDIEAALVGATANEIIIAFRGTITPAFNWASFWDWFQDFCAPPASNQYIQGEVHEGFLFAVSMLVGDIHTAIHTLDPNGTLPIYITGHSKGGGMAPIAAMYMKNRYGMNITQTITFAGPNPGNAGFQSAYNSAFPNHLRYENYLDLVPLMPPVTETIDVLELIPDLPQSFINKLNDAKAWDYQSVGTLEYIDASAEVNAYNWIKADVLLPVRLAEISEKIVTFQLSEIGDAHHASCGYRYMEGTCGADGVCPF